MKLSKTSEYALRILIYMAKEPSSLYSAKKLIEELKISDKYLRRLMTDLSKAGFIESIQGRDGGYKFAKSIDDIYLFDIVDAIEGMDELNECVLGFETCSCENPCAMHDSWLNVRNELSNMFHTTKLSDMDFDKILKY